VVGVAFSPDGEHIISGSFDGIVCIWNVEDQSLILPIPQVYFESWRGTGFDRSDDNVIPEFALVLYDLLRSRPNQIPILGGWIRIPGSSKRLWIPPRYRGIYSVDSSRVCLGTTTGHVVFIDMTEEA